MTTLPTDKNINAALMLHWGWTDLIQLVGLVRYYQTKYKSITLVCLTRQREFAEALYPDFNLIFVPEPDYGEIDFVTRKLFDEDYLFLMDGHQCSSGLIKACFRQNLIPKTEIQQINCHSLEITAWHRQSEFNQMDIDHPTFDQRIGFYTLSNLDYSIAFDYFKIIRNEDAEQRKYSELVKSNEYSVVHHVDGMNLSNINYPLVYLNDNSTKIVDMIKIIENAKEAHFYDSLYGILCYFLYFSNQLRGPKFYLHKYARMKIPKFFDYKKMEESGDWIVL
jgi:hypothetical protein